MNFDHCPQSLPHPSELPFLPSVSSSSPQSPPPGILEREAIILHLPAGVQRPCRKTPSYPLVSSLLSCVHFACEATDCPELAVENASLNCSSTDHYHGAQCTVSCQTGYVLQIQRDDELIKSQVCAGSGLMAPLQRGKADWVLNTFSAGSPAFKIVLPFSRDCTAMW